MSYVKRAGNFAKRVAQVQSNLELEIEAANKAAAQIIQDEVVARCPVKTGKLRALFASPSAIQKSWKFKGGYVFGLVTPALRSDGYYAKFVEYGTKGYYRGQFRAAGVTKSGRIKWKKVKRMVHPHPAHPFFRPGCAAGRARLKALYEKAMQEAFKDV